MLHKAALFLWEVYPHKLVSQSCPVVNIEEFWPATGQSNLAYKWLATTKASKVWFSYSHNCTLASGAVFHSVCQVWLPSGLPEFFTFSYCTWLWYWLIAEKIYFCPPQSAQILELQGQLDEQNEEVSCSWFTEIVCFFSTLLPWIWLWCLWLFMILEKC